MPILKNLSDGTGTIKYLSNTLIVTGYIPCDGASYSTSLYPSLFQIVGYTYGGSGASFNVPDLRGKTPIGVGQGSGLTLRTLGVYGVGANVGEENHTLSAAELATHTHTATTGTEVPLHTHSSSINYTTTNINGNDLNGHTHGYTHMNTAFDGDSGGANTMPNGDAGATSGGSGSLNHSHTFTASSAIYGTNHYHAYQTDSGTGSNIGHNNMQPSLVCGFYIKY